MSDDYLNLISKIRKARYFNIKRNGTIICRECRHKSISPNIHTIHVEAVHRNLHNKCPYCQKESLERSSHGRLLKKSTLHLKFCCFLHKVENYKYRILFNNNSSIVKREKTKSDSKTTCVKTSILSRQNFFNYNDFLVHILVYDTKEPPPHSEIIRYTEPVINIEQKIEIIRQFHSMIILNKTLPEWLSVDENLIEDHTERIVYNNTLEFNTEENIDCNLIRKVIVGKKLVARSYRYTLKLTTFIEYIHYFQDCIKSNCFIISRYVRIFMIDKDMYISMIMITNKASKCFYWSKFMNIGSYMFEISSVDGFIDVCYELGNNELSSVFFPINLKCNKQQYEHIEQIRNDTVSSLCIRSKINILLSPLRRNAKVYMYSQTIFGCIRAFDRLFQKNDLKHFLQYVVQKANNEYIIYYSSLKFDKSIEAFSINLHDHESFATESYLREIKMNLNKYLLNKKLFLINNDNIKLVVDKAKNNNNNNKDTDNEKTIFPYVLNVTNIIYTLTKQQTNIYQVAKYHQDKILYEIINVPNVDYLI